MIYRLTLVSEVYGPETFDYDTLAEAEAAKARIEAKAETLRDDVERVLSIEALESEPDEYTAQDKLDDLSLAHQWRHDHG